MLRNQQRAGSLILIVLGLLFLGVVHAQETTSKDLSPEQRQLLPSYAPALRQKVVALSPEISATVQRLYSSHTRHSDILTFRQMMQEVLADHQSMVAGIFVDNPALTADSARRLANHRIPRGGLLPYLEKVEVKNPDSLEMRNLWRLEWDNDMFVQKDNAFTNGWSLQRHSHQHDSWDEMGPSRFSAWISRSIPGLDDHGCRVVKRGTAISQLMLTPENLSDPDPQPGDVPWAGTLGWSESWYAFDNSSLNAFQIYVGILGPYSLAEQFQVRVHDWMNAETPLGWDNQLKTEPLFNLNYAYKRKLASAGEYSPGRFAGDLSVGVQAGLGNLSTFADLSIAARWGWGGLPKGFIHIPDPPGRGIALDPSLGVPGKLHIYFSLVARMTAQAYTVVLDGNTFRNSPHPGLEYDRFIPQTILGMHVASRRFSIHLNLYHYREPPFESTNPITDTTWGNVTLEYRL